jgi:hypothetical protein
MCIVRVYRMRRVWEVILCCDKLSGLKPEGINVPEFSSGEI